MARCPCGAHVRPLLLVLWAVAGGSGAAEEVDLASQWETTTRPFLMRYCHDCHGETDPEAKLDLAQFESFDDVSAAYQTWAEIARRVAAGEMPPKDGDEQPSQAERGAFVDWIHAHRRQLAQDQAGDPGRVLARRLSNTEWNHAVRDLTGIDMRPADRFPVDPANEAGFDNSGESLTMSPALLNKYLQAAREVVSHAVLTPTGIDFAPHPVTTETDRDKYAVKRIVDFYRRQPTDLADYFWAAWLLRGTEPTEAALANVARRTQVSPHYLKRVWEFLHDDRADVGPGRYVMDAWRRLPEPLHETEAARTACEAIAQFVRTFRPTLNEHVDNLSGAGVHKGSQAFVLWKNRVYAARRQSFDPEVLDSFGALEGMRAGDYRLEVPHTSSDRQDLIQALTIFCEVFPDAFFISERGRDYLDEPNPEVEKGRLLSAGFHSMMGYFRDDGPLYRLILNEDQRKELDALWEELQFVTDAPYRQYAGFVWFERTDSSFLRDPQFDFARAEDRAVTTEAMILQLADVYLQKVQLGGGGETVVQAVTDYFRIINEEIRAVEMAKDQAEPLHLEAVVRFAGNAYRRELTEPERSELVGYYHQLRGEGHAHTAAIEDCLVSILLSPHFCFRLDLLGDGDDVRPLSGWELASRLSFMLWAAPPDARLRERARDGTLQEVAVLRSEVRRLRKDPKVRGWATEFAANWLDYRRFTDHNSVDRNRFPEFDDALRAAMFEEPTRFLIDLAQRDGAVGELLDAQHTFVNRELAKHYGIPIEPDLGPEEWVRVENANDMGRGGLVPMAVFLTQNSPGLRTSPVKRGYWLVRRLLGEHIPPPPPDVPELPSDEKDLGQHSLTELLALHREHASCASCHARFDSLGLVLEGYDPVGRARTHDLSGRPVETMAIVPGGRTVKGLADLRDYLATDRQAEFRETFVRKLLAYALGRTLRLGDELLVESLVNRLARGEDGLGGLLEEVVVSRPFRFKRVTLDPLNKP